ncbi:hypothetical protein, partial [Komagataeibacter xylinus]|uniref:hypothetical protein n=1 Tax=Komagataeibacter xylinus TaxID=28448 RepID=UPI0022329DAE
PGPDGQQQRRQNGGITTTGYSLFKPKNCLNRRVHLSLCMARTLPPPHEGYRSNTLLIPRVTDDRSRPQGFCEKSIKLLLIQTLKYQRDTVRVQASSLMTATIEHEST